MLCNLCQSLDLFYPFNTFGLDKIILSRLCTNKRTQVSTTFGGDVKVGEERLGFFLILLFNYKPGFGRFGKIPVNRARCLCRVSHQIFRAWSLLAAPESSANHMCLAALLEGLLTSGVLSGVVSGGVLILLCSSGGFWGGFMFSKATGEISGGSVGSLSRGASGYRSKMQKHSCPPE